MFCNQCEQTAKGKGCDKIGVCGKTPEVAALQDLLTHSVKGLSLYAHAGRKVGVVDNEVNRFSCEAIFSTLTNVDFDPARFVAMIERCDALKERLKTKVKAAGGQVSFGSEPEPGFLTKVARVILGGGQPDFTKHPEISFTAAGTTQLVPMGEKVGFAPRPDVNADLESLRQILTYGLRGVAAYADHAAILGQESDEVYDFIHEAMAATLDQSLGLDELIGLCLGCGKANLKAMELLDAANTGSYGHPVPTEVPLGPKKGKAILVSGHDLKDLGMLLEQTAGKGINIYTHGEMLPCHGYPELKKHPHFHGHYGTAWQNQQKEFAEFPGAILMTTNCIQNPVESYKGNIFTTGLVGWPGVTHVSKDFSKVIEKALVMPGFAKDEDKGSVLTGFARNAVMNVAGTVIDAVKSGAIRHFFLVAGCDGAKPGRNYYTEFVEKVPQDCVVLTLACGKFRFFDKKLGDIGGIPRLLDIGQCNDAYSAIQIAVALAGAFNCGVNDLPLSMVLSWYEQKAVAILLTLLHLGIKGIRLGPSLPAFITPNVLQVLVDTFDIKPITTPDADLKAILG
ncbi:hydroxylamine reductase [Desulfomicrobium baculatum]|uniref:Hydroxylamine reductase n=1 Tax=Desulfomicrobium baculatum (strain DSM 4028 / VKM B-1378 / X) TaxID=525897 RepID=C7LV12_DESBD|nr:hydroxylamine reductase [Desulfomicrobium baculatum]ACU91016.1 hybrid cluster protein [Desulfomicrobium baculatum DSM 4028]